MNKNSLKRLFKVIAVLSLILFGGVIISIGIFQYIENNEIERLNIEKENVEKEKSETIKKTILVEESFYGFNGLYIKIKNISDKNVIGLKINTTFTNNFGDTLCPLINVTNDYNNDEEILTYSTQTLILTGEEYVFNNKKSSFFIGKGDYFPCIELGELVSSLNEIKIKEVIIDTIVFEGGEKISLSE